MKSRCRQLAMLIAMTLGASGVHAACTFGGSGEPSLQSTFNTMLGAGAPNVATACVSDGGDGTWRTVGTDGSIDIAIELAGNAQTNEFGIYDLNDPTRRLTVFEGVDGAGSTATVRLRAMGNGTWRVGVLENNGSPGDNNQWTWLTSLNTSAFGFYLANSVQGTFYTQTALNTDHVDHMYAYQGNGSTFQTGPHAGELFTSTDYIMAWEDLNGGGDRDYQDFVAVLQDITPVPLPPAVMLFLSGLVALVGVSRSKVAT